MDVLYIIVMLFILKQNISEIDRLNKFSRYPYRLGGKPQVGYNKYNFKFDHIKMLRANKRISNKEISNILVLTFSFLFTKSKSC